MNKLQRIYYICFLFTGFNMKIAFYVSVFLLGFINLSVSQTTSRLPCIDKTFSIVAHVVYDSLGETTYLEADILKDIDSLNKNFAPICVSFEICEFNYIDNFIYEEINNKPGANNDEWDEVQVLYNVKNRINIYYTQRIETPSGAEGYAGLGKIADTTSSGIVVKSTGEKTLSHEMGHYFGLYHTFHTAFGNELVDGSNCATAGDLLCDTPADPNTTSGGNCVFATTEKDSNGQYYSPYTNNIMSYFPETCLCNPGFTAEQYKKMAETYLTNKGMW